MTTPFQAWKAKLLHDRGLRAPDGRPLYDYRLEDAEFASLESLLRERLSQYQPLASLGTIGGNVTGFPALFVLYAAEWWRQRYDGTGWSWEPIVSDLGADANGWNQAQRSACVSRGLQDWCLSLRETGGLRFLGAIALQGGLPMRLLAEAKGGLGRLLRSVLKEAAKSVVTINDIQGWVQSLDHYLPRTYRQTEIHVLLAEVVATVLRLKQEAGLTQSAGAVALIEQRIPAWRQRFPLPVGDSDAQGLIEQLIKDAAAVKLERQVRLFPVERSLEQEQDGLWHLHSSLTLPDVVAVAKLAALFSEDSLALPRLLDLALVVADSMQTISVRRLAGHDSYRVERRPLSVLDSNAAEEHVLRLSAADGQVWSIQAPRGEELSDGLPWVFDAREESKRLLRQGAGAVATNEVLVAIPSGWAPVPTEEGESNLVGHLHLPARRLYRVRGTACFSGNQGGSCRIRTGRADAKEESYEWIGQRLWHEFIRPSMAFLGTPHLYQTDEEGRSQRVNGAPGWRPLGTHTAHGNTPVGPVELWYPATGDVRHSARMVILPATARLRLVFIDVSTGYIHLENWGAISAQVLSPDVDAQSTCSGADLAVLLKVAAGTRSPEWVDLEVHWPQTVTAVRLRLPYPARGARIYNANNQEVLLGSLLAANQLAGVRIHGLAGNPAAMPRMALELRLLSKNRQSVHTINSPKNSVQAEIRLQDYALEIAHLLANDDSPDASIEATLRIGGEAATKLRIARYACRMERENGRVYLDVEGIQGITSESLATLPVMALRLEAPEEEAVKLTALTSQSVATGAWEFAPEVREAGSWLIFPAPQAALPFRPTLWPIKGSISATGKIAQAIGLIDPTEREQVLDAAIQQMASDFLEPSWADVERLASQLGHLPLVTLDIWRLFARSAAGMAALAVRFGTLPSGFLERFSLELPFSWETIPFIAWRSAIAQLNWQCDVSYGEASKTIFNTHLKNRIDILGAFHPALNNLLGFARCAALGEEPPEIRVFRHPGALQMLNGMLFQGERCPLQSLLQKHADLGGAAEQWPTYFNGRASEFRKHKSYGSFLCQQDFGYRDGLINLPIVLAIQAATNETTDWFEYPQMTHDLRIHIAFDSDWFTGAYDLTIARCLAVGLLKLEGST